MGKRNDEFRRKYNELDKLCREKYNMFRNDDGSRNNLSAIIEFANTLPEKEGETLRNIAKLRNLIIHNDMAEVNYNVIKDLDMFIAIIKGKYNISASNPFELVSYINYVVPKMEHTIRNLDLDEDGISYIDSQKIENDLYVYISKVRNASSLEGAKKVVRQFYNAIDRIEEHPIIVKRDLEEARREAIEEIKESLDETITEIFNPFKKSRAKAIAARYIALINDCTNVDKIEDYSEEACEKLDDFL